MLVAYFDESGTHGDSKLTTVAGLVGDPRAWGRLELPWKKRLGAQVPWFHATDCESTEGHFRHLDKTEATALSTDLALMIGERELAGISYSVFADEWKYGASENIKAAVQTPYHMCVQTALVMLSRMCAEEAPGEVVAVVFAQHEQFNEHTEVIHRVFRSSDRWKNLGSLTFADPRLLIPLQAADLFAYETYREMKLQQKLHEGEETQWPPPLATRPQLKAIAEGIKTKSAWMPLNFFHLYGDEIDSLIASSNQLVSGSKIEKA